MTALTAICHVVSEIGFSSESFAFIITLPIAQQIAAEIAISIAEKSPLNSTFIKVPTPAMLSAIPPIFFLVSGSCRNIAASKVTHIGIV